jgi:hypothetical protein
MEGRREGGRGSSSFPVSSHAKNFFLSLSEFITNSEKVEEPLSHGKTHVELRKF